MADVKPGDLYVGVVEVFSVLLPGAALAAYALTIEPIGAFVGKIEYLKRDALAQWVAFAFAAYALGHFIYSIAARLDDTYDVIRPILWRDNRAYELAKNLQVARLGASNTSIPMNPFSWAKSMLTLYSPTALAQVHRLEADSKFFRSMFVVLVMIAAVTASSGQWGSMIAAAAALLSYWRYVEQRHKSNEWTFRHVIVLCTTTAPAQPRW